MSTAAQKAKKALDTIARDPAAWDAMTSMLNARSLREALVNSRKERGYSQSAVAQRMGVSQSTVSEFETTRYPDPFITTLARYARAIDCRLDIDLLPIPDEPPAKEATP